MLQKVPTRRPNFFSRVSLFRFCFSPIFFDFFYALKFDDDQNALTTLETEACERVYLRSPSFSIGVPYIPSRDPLLLRMWDPDGSFAIHTLSVLRCDGEVFGWTTDRIRGLTAEGLSDLSFSCGKTSAIYWELVCFILFFSKFVFFIRSFFFTCLVFGFHDF